MGILQEAVSPHLNYFFCLEDDLIGMSRWIEFTTANEAVYSIELARLLMTATAEVDVVAKALCKMIDGRSDAANVNQYRSVLLNAVPMLPDAEVLIPRFGLSFRPWSNWGRVGGVPEWWTANNKVKHHRAENFSRANLKNVLNANAGLLVLLLLMESNNRSHFSQMPRLYMPQSFVFNEGNALRLIMPDGTNLPPNWQQF